MNLLPGEGYRGIKEFMKEKKIDVNETFEIDDFILNPLSGLMKADTEKQLEYVKVSFYRDINT